jgi:hypothetical protein
MKKLTTIIILLFGIKVFAQNVGINTTSPQTALDVKGGIRNQPLYLTGSGSNIVIPDNQSNINLSGSFTAQFSATIANPIDGQKLTIDNNSNQKGVLNSTVDIKFGLNEFTYSDGEWKAINPNAWYLNGNDGVSSASNFIGTINKQDLVFKTYDNEQMRLHQQGGLSIGTPIHTEALDLVGNANISGQIMPQGQSGQQGQFLRSNGDGTMNWAFLSKYPNSHDFYGLYDNVANTFQTYTFVVPNNITEIWAQSWSGGSGGTVLPTSITNTSFAKGGNAGSYLSAIVKVIPGETLTILAGNGGSSGVGGGVTQIVRGGTAISGINSFGVAIALIDPATNSNGILEYVKGSVGELATFSYNQAGTSLFYRVFSGGKGGKAFPANEGGAGVTVAYDNTTNNVVSFTNNGAIGATQGGFGGDGVTPGGGGGVGYGSFASFGGKGGPGYVILHW